MFLITANQDGHPRPRRVSKHVSMEVAPLNPRRMGITPGDTASLTDVVPLLGRPLRAYDGRSLVAVCIRGLGILRRSLAPECNPRLATADRAVWCPELSRARNDRRWNGAVLQFSRIPR
jgi:hypothetical protein